MRTNEPEIALRRADLVIGDASPAWERYRSQFRAYFEQSRATGELEEFPHVVPYPCLGEDTATTSFDRYYYYQDTWAARKIFEIRPEWFVDVGSTVLFSGIVSQIVPCTFVDIRPIDVSLKGLTSLPGSIVELPFETGSVPFLSSLCVIEHIGLGRYGDPIGPHGTRMALREIDRVLKPGGELLLSTNVGPACIAFNAHRIFELEQLMGMLPGYEVVDEVFLDPEPRDRSALAKLEPGEFVVWVAHLRKPAARKALDFAIQERKFVTEVARPVDAVEYGPRGFRPRVGPRTTIVLQGPIELEHDFTNQTIQIYRSLHPEAEIVLSTWEGEDEAALRRIGSHGASIVLSKKPQWHGESNINLQIASAAAGVRRACEDGAQYVLRTRTDQRLCAPDILTYLKSLVDTFPVQGGASQRERLVGVSLNTFKYRMYGLSDMFLYGCAADMEAYWNAPLDERRFGAEDRRRSSLRDFAMWRICEVYLATHFLRRTDWELAWTLQDWWKALADRFCIVDKDVLDLYWPKYSKSENRWRTYQSDWDPYEEVQFRDWLILNRNLPEMGPIPEERLGSSEMQPW